MSNKTFELVLAGVIIFTYLICSFIDILFSALRDKLKDIETKD